MTISWTTRTPVATGTASQVSAAITDWLHWGFAPRADAYELTRGAHWGFYPTYYLVWSLDSPIDATWTIDAASTTTWTKRSPVAEV